MRCVLFVARHAWILLESIHFIVMSFLTLGICMTLLGCPFLYIQAGGSISMKKEALINFLTDSLDRRSAIKLAYVMVYKTDG